MRPGLRDSGTTLGPGADFYSFSERVVGLDVVVENFDELGYDLVAFFPDGHLLAQVSLDLLGHFLEEGAGGAAASGAGGDLRGEAANAQRLQNLLRYPHFFCAISAGGRS